RVSTAKSQATSGSDCWGQSFAYDRYANLTAVSSTQCSAPILSLSVDTDNQITNSGFSYDAAGDLTGDGVNTYSWNAEAHLKSAAGVTYTYDGDLRRVEKSNGTLYWYCAACGKVLAESDLSGTLTSEYTYFGERRIARRDVSSGNVYYIFSDRLGSYRTLTDSSGNVKGESDYYPFGAERVISSTVTDNFRFAGMEWDSEDGLNHTLYRQYTPAQGRWESPDPIPGCISNPQGHNLYSYVLDNPANHVDPLGLQLCPPGCDFVEDEGSGYCDCPSTGGGIGSGGGPCTNVVGAGGARHPDHLPVCPKPPAGGGGGGGGRVNKLICGPTGHVTFDWTGFTSCLEILEFGYVAPACLASIGPCAAAIIAVVGSGGALSPVLTICAPAAASCGISGLILVGCGIHATHCEPNVVVRPPVKGPRQTWTPAAALGNHSQD